MAIRWRKGLLAALVKSKLLPGEACITTDTGELYYCYSAGNVKCTATIEDLQAILVNSEGDSIVDRLNTLENNLEFSEKDFGKLVFIGDDGRLFADNLVINANVLTYDAVGSVSGYLEFGKFVEGDGKWNVSIFIPIPTHGINDIKLSFYANTAQWYGYGFYSDESMNSLVSANTIYASGETTLTIPSESHYFRVSFLKVDVDSFWVKMSVASRFSDELDALKAKLYEFDDELETAVTVNPIEKIYNGVDHTVKGWLTTGGLSDIDYDTTIADPIIRAEWHLTTIYMPIATGKTKSVTYKVNSSGSYSVQFYTSINNNGAISASAGGYDYYYHNSGEGSRTVTAPSTAKYARVSFPWLDRGTFEVVVSSRSELSEVLNNKLNTSVELAMLVEPITTMYPARNITIGRLNAGGSVDPSITNWAVTDYLPCSSNAVPRINICVGVNDPSAWYTYDFFDADKNVISNTFASRTFSSDGFFNLENVPSNAVYIRMCFPYDSSLDDPTSGFYVNITTVGKLAAKLSEIEDSIGTTVAEAVSEMVVLDPITTRYLASDGFTVGRLNNGGYIDTGVINYAVTDYLSCKSAVTPTVMLGIKVSGEDTWYTYDFFDADKNVIANAFGSISFQSNEDYEVPNVPEDAAYLRVCFPYISSVDDPTYGFSISITTTSELASRLGGNGNVNFNYADYEGVPHYGSYRLPILCMEGDTSIMSKDKKVTLNYKYRHYISRDNYQVLSGTLTCKWQGSSSLYFPKKNYTITFDTAFNAKLYQTEGQQMDVNGWGSQKKYCLKANFVDQSQARNILCARLWAQIVDAKSSNAITQLEDAPNNGAIDGFPILVAINGEYQGLYTWNIPKDRWMFAMGNGTNECILCADATGNVAQYKQAASFKHTAVCEEDASGETDFTIEYITDEDDISWMITSLNILIVAAINAENIDEIKDMLDVDSAIDYMLFTAAIGGMDNVVKNYLLCTYDGTKWFFSPYDMDGVLGNYWSGERYINAATGYPLVMDIVNDNRVFELIWNTAKDRLLARWKELRKRILTEANFSFMAYNFTAAIPDAVRRHEDLIWTTAPATLTNNVHQMTDWFKMRLTAIDNELS